MPYQPAVLGPNTRLNNFRLNYLTAEQAADRPLHLRIILGGIDITQPGAPMRMLYKSMAIRDALFDAPNTCDLAIFGAPPIVGQPLEVWFGDPAVLLFSGEVQTVARTYKGRPTTVVYPVTAIDDTARANRKRPLGRFVNTSATTIAQWLISTFAPGFSSAGVAANLAAVSITFDGSEAGMKGCLTALAKLIGGYWYFENKTLYLFVTPPGTPPDPIDDTPGRFLHDPAIAATIDKSQVRTRVYGKGASTRILAALEAGATLLPIENAEMFNPAGGQAIAAVVPDGAAFQRVTYTGVQLGGGGGLVGPGASPSAAPALAAIDGAGVESGTHQYAYTFVTAAGESVPSPAAAITVGAVSPPAAAPVPGAVVAGGAIEPGTFQYLVTFVTAVGETIGTPASAPVTTSVGSGVPSPGATTAVQQKVVGNLSAAVPYRYKTTFTVAGGESLPGDNSSNLTLTPPPPPGFPIPAGTPPLGSGGPGNMIPGLYSYVLVFVVGGYETAISGILNQPVSGTSLHFPAFEVSGDPRVTQRRLYRQFADPGQGWGLVTTLDNQSATQYTDTKSNAELGGGRGTNAGAIGTPPPGSTTVTIPTSSDPRTVGRKIYRSDNNAAFRFLATVSNNSATQYVDNTASVATNPDAPTTDTTGGASYQTVPLSGILTGAANVTARKLYRWRVDVGWKLAATIGNNTQTTYTDTQPTASLAAGTPPDVTTAYANRVQVTLAVGGASVTNRKVYRTVTGASALQWLFTIADNTTTLWTDVYGDASLTGRPAPPAVDTSGLAQPSGQVPAGSTTIIVANTGAFAAAGGWAVVGNGDQVIRYAGKTATTLTGIPAAGAGALVASVSYNSTITAAPALLGVTGLVAAIIRNSAIYVWVQRDDLAAQALMISYDGGGDGVYEHIWSDERRSEASLRQVCDAQLALYSRPLVTVTYATRDLKTKSGKTVTIDLATPAIAEALTIQDVAISEIGIRGVRPKFTVTASSVRQSLEAVLQMLIRKADA